MPTSARSFVAVCALAFAVLFAYALSRPPAESAFLEVHGSDALPWVWAAVGVAAVLAVTGYNQLAARLPLDRVLLLVAVGAALALVLLNCLRAARVPYSTAALYVWKDVHVVVLLEIVWSFANVVFRVRTARLSYGLFCACGSLGGMAGNLVTGELASRFGTDAALWAPLPLLLAVAVAALLVPEDVRAQAKPKERGARAGGLAVIAKSPYLLLLLALVLLTQISITLVDYTYNEVVEATFADVDERTRLIGRVYAAIDLSALALQLSTAPILRLVGVPATLLAIPALLGSAVTAAALAPRFLLMAITKVTSKAFDYSLFRAAKEILYIPLTYAEKTRGKAMIDMLAYRVAKVGASLLLGGFVFAGHGEAVLWVVLALVAVWLAVTWRLTRRYRARVSRDEEVGRD